MRLLFEIDKKDYENCTYSYKRDSARSIIIINNKLAMIHSTKYDYYKFPGGGIEKGETYIDAVIRETREEAGLIVKHESVKEFGYVHRIQKNVNEPSQCFIQDNFYYLCEVENEVTSQELDDYESDENFVLEIVDPQVVISKNNTTKALKRHHVMLEREVKIIKLLISEGYLK